MSSCTSSTGQQDLLAQAKRIHRRAVTIDTHVDIEGADYATKDLDPGIDNPRPKCDLVKMEQGELDAVFLVVFVAQGRRDVQAYRQAYDSAMAKFEAIGRLTRTMYPDRCVGRTWRRDPSRRVGQLPEGA